jgi:GTPase SAR1 family protein
MLKNQKMYCDYLRDVESLIEGVGLSNQRVGGLHDGIAEAQLLVPVIGAFSAGKSTLLNSFLGQDYLSVDITPETALATELHYSQSERLEAVSADGRVDRYNLTEFDAVKEKASEYRFVRAYIKHDALQAIQPLVLVDMPGFDSPLDLHNQAIMEYIGRGTHYVVLTSVEEGNLTRSMLRQIAEVYDVNKGISFFLSKSNLRSPVEVGEIAEKISSQLEDYFDAVHEVVPVGLDGGKDLARIVDRIDPEQLVVTLFKNLVMDIYGSCKGDMNTRISTLGKTKEENESTLKELQKGMSYLIRKKEEMLEEAQEKYTDVRVGRIVERVGQELSNSIEELTSTAISSGAESLNQVISELVRHSLLHEVRSSMKELNDQIVADISFELQGINSVLSKYDSDEVPWLDRAVISSETLLNSGVEKLDGWNETLSGKDGSLYKVIATILGLTTSIVAPVVELIIIFLPEILSGLMKKSREQRQLEEVRSSILTRTIPDVKLKLRGQLPEIFNEQVKVLINEIGSQFESKVEEQRQIIASEKEDILFKKTELESQISAYSDAVDQLNARTNVILSDGESNR